MKKLLLTIMFVICAVLLSACSKNELELGTYTTENSSSKLILLEDQKFEFHPYFLYGYSPNGDYRIEKGKRCDSLQHPHRQPPLRKNGACKACGTVY